MRHLIRNFNAWTASILLFISYFVLFAPAKLARMFSRSGTGWTPSSTEDSPGSPY